MAATPILSYAAAMTRYGVRVMNEDKRTIVVLPRPAWHRRRASVVVVALGIVWAVGISLQLRQKLSLPPFVGMAMGSALMVWMLITWNRAIRITIDRGRVHFDHLNPALQSTGPDRVMVLRHHVEKVEYVAHARSIFVHRRAGDMVQIRLSYSDAACEEVAALLRKAIGERVG